MLRRVALVEVDGFSRRLKSTNPTSHLELLDVKACERAGVPRGSQAWRAIDGSFIVAPQCGWHGNECSEIAAAESAMTIAPAFLCVDHDERRKQRATGLGLPRIGLSFPLLHPIVTPSLELVQALEFAFALLARLGRD